MDSFQKLTKQQKDIYAVSYRADSYQNIERHFLSLFTPFHFGQYVLEFFQDKRFLKIFAKLKKAQQKADLFMDDHYQAFRIGPSHTVFRRRFYFI